MPRKNGEAKISVPVDLQKRFAAMAKASMTSQAKLLANMMEKAEAEGEKPTVQGERPADITVTSGNTDEEIIIAELIPEEDNVIVADYIPDDEPIVAEYIPGDDVIVAEYIPGD